MRHTRLRLLRLPFLNVVTDSSKNSPVENQADREVSKQKDNPIGKLLISMVDILMFSLVDIHTDNPLDLLVVEFLADNLLNLLAHLLHPFAGILTALLVHNLADPPLDPPMALPRPDRRQVTRIGTQPIHFSRARQFSLAA